MSQSTPRRERRLLRIPMDGGSRPVRIPVVIVLLAHVFAAFAHAERLDELPLDRWKKLREVERYQLNIAEKYFREKNWKVAAAEYEKFLTLYEDSEGAAYSQLKWSLCQVRLRRHNTAISEGFQSVVDYWPDAPEAVAAEYYIGQSWKDIGEVRKAKKAYQRVIAEYPQHLATVYATVDLIDLTTIDGDVDTRVMLWKQLTFDTKRTRDSQSHCINASQQLATWQFENGSFSDGVKALATTYPEEQLARYVAHFGRGPVSRLTGDDQSKSRGHQLADDAVAWIRRQVPADRSTPETTAAAKEHWYHMADLQAASRRVEKVQEVYDQIFETFGTDDTTLGRLAGWLKSIGRYDEARTQYTRFENKVEAQNQIGYSHRQQRKYDLAVQAYRRNLSLDPENIVRWNGEIAQAWREARRFDEAIAVYQELLTLDKEQPERWRWAMATAYRDAGRYKEAIGHFRQCNNFPGNYGEMALCHRALKDYREAITLYNQIIAGAPKSAPWALLQIGHTYEQASNRELAIKAFQQVCKNYPKDSHASRAHAHLQDKYKITVTLGGAKDE